MIDEVSIMEKKPNVRSLQPQGKPGTEGKKSGETVAFGKYNRRREPTTSNNGKNDPRKPNSNKVGKYSDKRPRPRGQYYSSGKQETQVDDIEGDPEHGSISVPGKKKQNLNHLLNFTLAPRPAVGSGSNSLQPRERPVNWLATQKHKYNKEQFLQANCQFIVKSGIDYTIQLADPDILVDWSNIEQIRLRSTEWLACPICLDSPVAAKMTRCGHVYCWACILHYLALSDKTWRKCPICYESIHKKDLKSVTTIANTPSCVGEIFTLRLMKRERGRQVAVPMGEAALERQLHVPLHVHEANLNTSYSKLLVASESDVENVLRLERLELETSHLAAQGEPEVCFIEQALELLSEREKSRNETDVRELDMKLDSLTVSVDTDRSESIDEHSNADILKSSSDEEDQYTLLNVAPGDVETEHQISGQKPFYFYQAADGQNVFLTALNMRMLETQYGGLAQSPLVISAPVLEKESGSMTRELRNRLRALSHLPLTAAFELLELDLSDLVGEEVLDAFSELLRQREHRRRTRDREERRRERRIIEETGLQWGLRPTPRIRLDSAKHFPPCGEEEFPLPDAISPQDDLRDNPSRSVSMCSDASSELEPAPAPASELVNSWPTPIQHHYSPGPSFAQMLKVGAKSGNVKKPAWGRAEPVAQTLQQQPVRDMYDDDEDNEYSYVPRYQQSFSDAISKALERADVTPDVGGGSKKKKKRKQKLLFASGMAFSAK